MAKEDESPKTPITPKPSPNVEKEKSPLTIYSQSSSSHPVDNNNNNVVPAKVANGDSTTPTKNPQTPKDFILSVASKIAAQPLQNSDPQVWGVLTAISDTARKRSQGMNMLLVSNEHSIGRLVKDAPFQIISPAVSAHHCKIYKKRASSDEDNSFNGSASVFLKDTSTNGTYVNWEKLSKGGPEVKLCHGDIVSVAFPPEHGSAFAFVFREVLRSSSHGDSSPLKRKSGEPVSASKKLKGIGIGATEGPISLDDFKSLQRSNTELRKMLEEHVLTIESLRSENRAAIERHEVEMKDLKESISESYVVKLKELQQLAEAKEKELMNLNKISAEQKHALDDLNERLNASLQSCVEANEVITSQKASISELKALLAEEHEQRREEREKAAADLKASIQRIQAEAQDEVKRISDAADKREKEQQEMINKLQESEKERCSLVETLRSKLEDTREKLVVSENKVRQLEAQVREEQSASATITKKKDELELDNKRLKKELESEKAAREEAWAKVSALELEINAAMRDLDFERRRLKGARERIMLRETQLRSFYSTTEEIQVLFAKQQEQLKAMQRTLEDEENYQTTSLDFDLNLPNGNIKELLGTEKGINNHFFDAAKAFSSTSTRSNGRVHVSSSSDEASVTEKHDCNMKIHGNDEDTQEVEFTGVRPTVQGGFGSDINGLGTAPIIEEDLVGTEKNHETDGMETAPVLEGDLHATEAIFQTEVAGLNGIDLNKCGAIVADTIELDDETNGQNMVQDQHVPGKESDHMNFHYLVDTQPGGSIRTADLLTSEVPGSWADSTAPSVYGENDTQKSKGNEDDHVALHDANGIVAESQTAPISKLVGTKWNEEQELLGETTGSEVPYKNGQSNCAVRSQSKEVAERVDISDSDTEGSCSNGGGSSEVNTDGESDDETIDSDGGKEDLGSHDAMDEDDIDVSGDSDQE
ncbi:OLC1v1038945C1 [Oldenlandia corymbosa var. corymbosa]|uniref:OLC1v1038945C1 n=1 Tax=Oldenlandia corymbosa var. corymbosa TaxID=529605 RepID=A0AAV1D1W5_OLDCO|nr:OLC1v1038945C1 [Oldenlandia corymbosa var. corymbosa]